MLTALLAATLLLLAWLLLPANLLLTALLLAALLLATLLLLTGLLVGILILTLILRHSIFLPTLVGLGVSKLTSGTFRPIKQRLLDSFVPSTAAARNSAHFSEFHFCAHRRVTSWDAIYCFGYWEFRFRFFC